MYGAQYGHHAYTPRDTDYCAHMGHPVWPNALKSDLDGVLMGAQDTSGSRPAFSAVACAPESVHAHNDRQVTVAIWAEAVYGGYSNPLLYEDIRYEEVEYEEGESRIFIVETHKIAYKYAGYAGVLADGANSVWGASLFDAVRLCAGDVLLPAYTDTTVVCLPVSMATLNMYDDMSAWADSAYELAAAHAILASSAPKALQDVAHIVRSFELAILREAGVPPLTPPAITADVRSAEYIGSISRHRLNVVPHNGAPEWLKNTAQSSTVMYAGDNWYAGRDIMYRGRSGWEWTVRDGHACVLALSQAMLQSPGDGADIKAVIADIRAVYPLTARVASTLSTRSSRWQTSAMYGLDMYTDIQYRAIRHTPDISAANLEVSLYTGHTLPGEGTHLTGVIADLISAAFSPNPLTSGRVDAAVALPEVTVGTFDGSGHYDVYMALATGSVLYTDDSRLFVGQPDERIVELMYVVLGAYADKPAEEGAALLGALFTSTNALESARHGEHVFVDASVLADFYADNASVRLPATEAVPVTHFTASTSAALHDIAYAVLGENAELTLKESALIRAHAHEVVVTVTKYTPVDRVSFAHTVCVHTPSVGFAEFGGPPILAHIHEHIAHSAPSWDITGVQPIITDNVELLSARQNTGAASSAFLVQLIDGLRSSIRARPSAVFTHTCAEPETLLLGMSGSWASTVYFLGTRIALSAIATTVLIGTQTPAATHTVVSMRDGVFVLDEFNSATAIIVDVRHGGDAWAAPKQLRAVYATDCDLLVAQDSDHATVAHTGRILGNIPVVQGPAVAPSRLAYALSAHVVECLLPRFVKCPNRDTGGYLWECGPGKDQHHSGLYYEGIPLLYSVSLEYDYEPDGSTALAFTF